MALCANSRANGVSRDGAACPRMPSFRVNGVARTRGKAGRCALACPCSARTGWRALGAPPSARMGKGGPRCGVPARTGRPGVSCPPSARRGRVKAGVACALGFPISACTSGVAKGGSNGDRACALVHPLPCEWGRVGPGGVPLHASIPRIWGGAAQGRRGGAGGDGGCALACGVGRGGVGGDGERGRHALAHPPPPPREWGRVGPRAACPLPARTGPFMGREGPGREGEGGGGVPSYAPLLCEWAAAAAHPRAPPFRANGVARTEEKGRAQEAKGRRALCATYLRAKGAAAVNAGERVGERGVGLPSCDANGVGVGVHTHLQEWRGERRGKGRSRPCGGSNTCLPRSRVHTLARHANFPPHSLILSHPSPLLSSTPLPSPFSVPSLSPAPFALKRGHKRTGQRPTSSPSSRAGKGVHEDRGGVHEGMPHPLPFPSVRATPFARKGGARGRAAAAPPLPPLPIRTEGVHTRARRHRPLPLSPAPPFPCRGRGVHKGMPPPLPIAPDTSPSCPIHVGWRHVRACHPWPFPIHTEGGCAKACRLLTPSPPAPPLLPWAMPPHTHGMEAREGTPPGPTLPHSRGRGCTRARALSPLLPPLATPLVHAEMGHPSAHATPTFTLPLHAEGGHDAPGHPVHTDTPHLGPPFPIRTEGGAPSARHPVRAEQGHTSARCPTFPLVRATPFTRKGGMRGQAAPSRDTPFVRELAHEAVSSSRTGVVSVRPRSPHPHPVSAA
ncbi:hypothetical protein EDB85DRAFT_1901427 [Lactarius pseudohatsudake]|nr:hypothetical protein EDB85DRAFT_1901427 [Lactarius pseudohatsudake]